MDGIYRPTPPSSITRTCHGTRARAQVSRHDSLERAKTNSFDLKDYYFRDLRGCVAGCWSGNRVACSTQRQGRGGQGRCRNCQCSEPRWKPHVYRGQGLLQSDMFGCVPVATYGCSARTRCEGFGRTDHGAGWQWKLPGVPRWQTGQLTRLKCREVLEMGPAAPSPACVILAPER